MKIKKEDNLAHIDKLIEKHKRALKKLEYYKEYNLRALEDQQIIFSEEQHINFFKK